MKITIVLIVVAASALLTSCGTVKGIGQDVQQAGRGISNSASR
jgi:predicted small secreted protein